MPFLSPKAAAKALGVSESSLKRWCDSSVIPSVKTPGGHRKIDSADLIAFARKRKLDLVLPELLGLPKAGSLEDQSTVVESFTSALLSANEQAARQMIINLYLSGEKLARIFDEVVAIAFERIGLDWECRQAEIYQERLSCEICRRSLFELRQVIPTRQSGKVAIGSSLSGDPYQLPTTMVELLLRERGFRSTSLGSSIPAESLLISIEKLKPSLFWLSVSHIADLEFFKREFDSLSAACFSQGIALVIGGNALNAEIRKHLRFTVHCDTMHHLDSFLDQWSSPEISSNSQEAI